MKRYDFDLVYPEKNPFSDYEPSARAEAVPSHSGGYVLFEDAREAIAAKDAEIAKMRAEVEAAHETIGTKIGVNRCTCCGTAVEFDRDNIGNWRTFGNRDGAWQHACPNNHPQAGYFDATFFPGTLTADLARLRAIEAAAVAWAEWQEKADALEPAIYLHHPNEASTVYEGLNASAAALIKSVKP